MKCATSGCSHEAPKQCSECEEYFCDQHVELCNWCQAYVCSECRDEHESNNPLHEEGAPQA